VSEGQENKAVIRTPDQRLRVFVSSTLGELADERRAVSRAIAALRLTPVMFEQGARPHPPRELYRAYLAQSEVFVGLYWQRYGQAPPGADISGLEEEFDLSARLPKLLYVKEPAPGRDPRLARLLDRIRQEASVSYRTFSGSAELGRLVRNDLAALLSERFTVSSAARAAPGRVRGPRPLPVGSTSLVGREEAIGEVAALVTNPEVRLVTLTGPGGVGKTRLALAAGERLRHHFNGSTAFVPLAAVTDPGQVLAGIARAVGADPAGTSSALQALAEQFWNDAWLLILDNLEQVAKVVARDMDELLARCSGLTLLTTSRMVLGLRAEREYPVAPLPPPPDLTAAGLAEVAASPAVALFVDRARAVRSGFTLTAANAAVVAEICRRLEGLPLAIELAAARIRLLDPAALRDRLCRSLDALGTGAVDMPERQQTLRATVEWSVGLLEDAERSLLEVVAVFVNGWTFEAAAEVAGLSEDRALELTEALARHSLVQPDSAGPEPRSRMLETIREFVAERLAARPDVAEIRRRHADYYRTLAEKAGPPLRRGAHNEWARRLEVEAGNLAAAVRWYMAHDPAPLPGLFVALLPLWALDDDFVGEARTWVDHLLPTICSLDPEARAQLLLAAVLTSREVDDDAALAARDRLGAVLESIRKPYLHAVAELAMAISSGITGDWDRAVRESSAALTELRGQDEPFWTALALVSLGAVETALGRYDDALGHLREMSQLAKRFDIARLIAAARVQLGTLAVMQGRLDEASALLEEGLRLSLEMRSSTRNVSLILAAFAQLAVAEDDLEQSALLAGAAEGVRQRAGLRAWPAIPRREGDLATQIPQALEASRFDELFAAGTRLSQREAVAAARSRRGAS
jgi:predicted ATPase